MLVLPVFWSPRKIILYLLLVPAAELAERFIRIINFKEITTLEWWNCDSILQAQNQNLIQNTKFLVPWIFKLTFSRTYISKGSSQAHIYHQSFRISLSTLSSSEFSAFINSCLILSVISFRLITEVSLSFCTRSTELTLVRWSRFPLSSLIASKRFFR